MFTTKYQRANLRVADIQNRLTGATFYRSQPNVRCYCIGSSYDLLITIGSGSPAGWFPGTSSGSTIMVCLVVAHADRLKHRIATTRSGAGTSRSVKIPDYISPIVAYRVWRWDDTGLKSLNGEPWLPDRPVEARCRVAPAAHHVQTVDRRAEVPDRNCTCGVYAAKNVEHRRQLGYAGYGVSGEVYLSGRVVQHTLGWRARFAYPKTLILPLPLLPFTLAGLNARLLASTAFGIDIFVLRNGEIIRLWKHATGYDADGLDHIINLRQEHYLRQQQERALKKGERVALLGRGIAVVQQVDDKAAVVVLGNRVSLKIVRKDIVLNKQNMRWECEAKSQRLRS